MKVFETFLMILSSSSLTVFLVYGETVHFSNPIYTISSKYLERLKESYGSKTELSIDTKNRIIDNNKLVRGTIDS